MTGAHGLDAVLIDDTALLALGAGHQLMSRLVSEAHYSTGPSLHAPAMCLAAASALRPGLGEHIGSLDAVSIMTLDLSAALAAGAAVAGGIAWGRAHAVVAARPGPEWPIGLPVVTRDPDTYRRFGLDVVDLG